MEQEKILSEITTKIGETSLSQRTLQDYVSNNLPAEGTEPDEAYWNKHVNFLKSLSGQYNHDVAERVEAFKKDYKPGDGGNVGDSGLVGDAIKRIESLEKTIKEDNKRKELEGKRKNVLGKGDELNVSNKALWNDAVNMVDIKDNMSDDDLLSAAKKTYESKLKAYVGEGASPYGGIPKGGQTVVDEEAANAKRESFKKGMIARGKLPKDEKM